MGRNPSLRVRRSAASSECKLNAAQKLERLDPTIRVDDWLRHSRCWSRRLVGAGSRPRRRRAAVCGADDPDGETASAVVAAIPPSDVPSAELEQNLNDLLA